MITDPAPQGTQFANRGIVFNIVGVNESRIRAVNGAPLRGDRDFVLYWMIAFRRPRWNHALDRAVDHAYELGKPLVVLEALRSGYRWASDRLHRFVIDGMHDHRKAFEEHAIAYYPYVEPDDGAGSGLLETMARKACIVVTDDFPCFFLPRMVGAAGRKLDVRLEAVDGNGLYPMRDTDRVFTTAASFRRHLQKRLPEFFEDRPRTRLPNRGKLPSFALPTSWIKRWPPASEELLSGSSSLDELPIDHDVPTVNEHGGESAGRERLSAFVEDKLPRYAERNHPDDDVSSGLSPYLHFGHVSAQEVFWRVVEEEEWSPDRVADRANGSRSGWWRLSEAAEDFLDELITWRELGYNRCALTDDYDQYESLPDWARETLEAHVTDERPHLYLPKELENAETHDEIWNAAQRQLMTEGRLHNYLRMLWGKKILEWSPSPKEALEVMIDLNNKYGLDGRNPNSYSGIFWVLGRYDRAWGPERPVFGKVRYMSSESTRKKLRLNDYLERWGERDEASS